MSHPPPHAPKPAPKPPVATPAHAAAPSQQAKEQEEVPEAREPELWEQMQIKTFTGWCNVYLSKRNITISNIETDWDDGVALFSLLEVISNQSLGKCNMQPKSVIHRQNNLSICTTFINKFLKEAKLGVSYGPQDILDHNRTLILGMIWTLIHKYAIAGDGLEGKEGLLLWCKKNTAGYKNVKIENFSTSWNDGLAFCALIHRFRPDLLDFHSLKPENKLANLQLAFKVAAESLEIPALLDANDVAGRVPDSKSIMTYVSFYWKVFSKLESGAVGRERVAMVLGQFRANQLTADDYVTRTTAVERWLREMTAHFSTTHFGDSLEAVQASLLQLNDFREVQKPSKTAEWRSLATQLRNLIQKQRAEHAKPFTPPAGLTPEEIEQLWEQLIVLEKQYESGLLAALTSQRLTSKVIARLLGQTARLQQWCESKQQYLASTDYGDSRGAVEGLLKKHQAFLSELGIFEHRAEQCLAEGPQYAETRDAAALVASQLEEIKVSGAERQRVLEERLQQFVEFENTCVHFSALAEGLNAVYEEIEDTISLPVTSYSVKEVEVLNEEEALLKNKFVEQDAVLQELAGIEEVFAGAENPFTRFTVADLQQRKDTIAARLLERDASLEAEASKQQAHEFLRVEFANQANQFADWCAQHIKALDEDSTFEGDLNEQFAAIEQTLQGVLQYGDECITYLQKVNLQLVENAVTDNEHTTHSLQDLVVEYESLKTGYAQKQALIKEKILARQGMAIKPEQLREFQEAFNYFDKDHSGTIDKEEFRMCQESLGQVLSEEEVNAAFEKVDKDKSGLISFDEFVSFMISKVTVSDSYEDVLAAVQNLTNGRSTITAQELNGFLAPEVAEYVMSHSAADNHGNYDYVSLLSEVFDTSSA